jgi:exo-1,4-beta-D-glucosaminidase
MNRNPNMEEMMMHCTRLTLLAVAAGLSLVTAGTVPARAAASSASPACQLPLRDGWTVQSSAKEPAPGEQISTAAFQPAGWYPTTVPKTVLAVLVDNKVYPDPYYGTNLKSIPGYLDGNWLIMKEGSPFRDPWWYRLEFSVPPDIKGRVVTLHFDGISYKASVWLNGSRIADSDTVRGMFRRFEFDVSGKLNYDARNVLAVQVIPSGLLTTLPSRTKQIEAVTGWDDHNPQPPDRNMGLWADVFLRVQGPVALRNAYVETQLEVPALDQAALTVSAFVTNHTDQPVTGELVGKIESLEFSQTVSLRPGEEKEVFFRPEAFPQLKLRNPRVWWPNPLGKQELYDLDLRFLVDKQVSDRQPVRFGIRQLDSVINDENWRRFRINGHDILIRGGAWMTSDMMLNLSDRRYTALARYAREANLNMLRSEGFSIRETEDFYNRCDELGVMVTQQIFGRNIPDEALAVACIEDMMLRIRNHPSLAHFLGHDETFPTPTLNKAYLDMIERFRLHRTYQPHSGAFSVSERKRTGGTRTGTLELWTYACPSHYYLRKSDGAWGFAQSGGIGGITVVRDSLRQMMPEDQLWPPLASEAWSFHTVTQGAQYFTEVKRAMARSYGAPKDLDDFCNKAYAMNYNSARGMFEAYGRNKYSATGITTWKYDAAWPAATTWAYVDWYLRPTGAYFGAKKACEPLHVQYAYDDNSIYVINSLYQSFSDLEVSATVYSSDLAPKLTKKAKVDVGPDGKTLAFKLAWPDGLTKIFFVKLELRDPSGALRSQNFYWLSTTPDIPGPSGPELGAFIAKPKSSADFTLLNSLPPVTLETSSAHESHGDEEWVSATIRNPSPNLAFLLQLAVTKGPGGREAAPCYWEDNYFSLLPGESRTVKAVVPRVELAGQEPTLRLLGWNVR